MAHNGNVEVVLNERQDGNQALLWKTFGDESSMRGFFQLEDMMINGSDDRLTGIDGRIQKQN